MLEPEVHLIEKYFQSVKKCLTMTNIRLKRNKEIALLAVDPRTGEKFHVESRVTLTGFTLLKKDTHAKKGMSKGKPLRRGLDFFDKEKFGHKIVVGAIKKIFGDADYRRILVVWDVKDDSVVKYAKERFGIEIWLMDEIITNLVENVRRGSRDDILRTVELMTRQHKRREEARC